MLAKSEILDGVAVVFDVEGVTPLGVLSACVFLHSEQKCDALKASTKTIY